MTTRTEPRTAAAHVPPTPPPPPPAGMALTELLAALEGERRTHAAAHRAGLTRQETTMREPTAHLTDREREIREQDARAAARAELDARRQDRRRRRDEEAAASIDAGVYGASFTLTPGHPDPRFPAVTRLDEELAGLESLHVPATVNHLRDLAYSSAVAAGWHDPKMIEGVMREPSAGERVALIHEEATELLQHARDGRPDGGEVWTPPIGTSGEPKPDSAGFELADIIIRCLDYAGRYGIDIGELIAVKMRYNRERAHRHGGKVL